MFVFVRVYERLNISEVEKMIMYYNIKDFMFCFLEVKEKNLDILDWFVIVWVILNVLVGSDMIVIMMRVVIYFLIKYLDCFGKLMEEFL